MLGLGVVPRFTRRARDRKTLFFRGGGVQNPRFSADFLAFPMVTCAQMTNATAL